MLASVLFVWNSITTWSKSSNCMSWSPSRRFLIVYIISRTVAGPILRRQVWAFNFVGKVSFPNRTAIKQRVLRSLTPSSNACSASLNDTSLLPRWLRVSCIVLENPDAIVMSSISIPFFLLSLMQKSHTCKHVTPAMNEKSASFPMARSTFDVVNRCWMWLLAWNLPSTINILPGWLWCSCSIACRTRSITWGWYSLSWLVVSAVLAFFPVDPSEHVEFFSCHQQCCRLRVIHDALTRFHTLPWCTPPFFPDVQTREMWMLSWYDAACPLDQKPHRQ